MHSIYVDTEATLGDDTQTTSVTVTHPEVKTILTDLRDGTYRYSFHHRTSEHRMTRMMDGHLYTVPAGSLAEAIGKALLHLADLEADPYGAFAEAVKEHRKPRPDTGEFDFGAALGDLMGPR